MNQLIKTYGIMINLDYTHQPKEECHAIWKKIVESMLLYGFHTDKRMFIMKTEKGQDFVCNQARQVLSSLDKDSKSYDKCTIHYITDFFQIDMSDYVDLRLPTANGITLKETIQKTSIIQYHSFI